MFVIAVILYPFGGFVMQNLGSQDTFYIQNKEFEFTSTPNFPDIPYAEVGRRAKVYRLQSGRDFFALKVFKYVFRNEASVANCAAIHEFREIPGLKAAQRTVLYPQEYPDLIQHYPDFAFAVLMPWMKGQSWYNTISQKTVVSPENSLSLARSLVEVLAGLEQRRMAHCDLSASNFIYSDNHQHVELVDLEEMFGKGLKTPDSIPAGTSGYTPKWIMDSGCWSAGCDRFSAGILISEILAWRDERIRDMTFGETFFEGATPTSDGDFGHKTERHGLMLQVLGEIHPRLAELFEQVWLANGIEDCPRIEEWHKALEGSPVLLIEPQLLDFGRFKEGESASTILSITNSGGGILSGQIIPQEPWAQVSPEKFECKKGQTSQHQVKFVIKTSGSAKSYREKAYHRDDFLLIDSNGNEKKKTVATEFVLFKKFPIAAAFAAFALVVAGIYFVWPKSAQVEDQKSNVVVASTRTSPTIPPTKTPNTDDPLHLLSIIPASMEVPFVEKIVRDIDFESRPYTDFDINGSHMVNDGILILEDRIDQIDGWADGSSYIWSHFTSFPNRGYLIQFLVEPNSDFLITLESGPWGESSYRAFWLEMKGQTFTIWKGTSAPVTQDNTQIFKYNTWYYLLILQNEEGFDGYLWEKEQPENLSVFQVDLDEEFMSHNFNFVAHAIEGNLQIDHFTEFEYANNQKNVPVYTFYARIKAACIYFRTGPGTNYPWDFKGCQGDSLLFLGVSPDKEWYKVINEGQHGLEGWIPKSSLNQIRYDIADIIKLSVISDIPQAPTSIAPLPQSKYP
ncbi:MAG: hypothetical protein JXB49_05025 [Bacteroidales bacterium]|nr:hypothetical protein [Bacteroidales bacterium]